MMLIEIGQDAYFTIAADGVPTLTLPVLIDDPECERLICDALREPRAERNLALINSIRQGIEAALLTAKNERSRT